MTSLLRVMTSIINEDAVFAVGTANTESSEPAEARPRIATGEEMEQTERVGAGGLTRRQVLKRGAVAGVATAWAVPVVQAIAMSPSHADTPSGSTTVNQPHTSTGSGGGTTQPVSDVNVSDDPLPNTGASAPVGKVAIGGAAAIVLGAGAYAAAGLGKPRREATSEGSEV